MLRAFCLPIVALTFLLPACSFALDIDSYAVTADPLVNFIQGSNCGKTVKSTAAESMGPFDMCPTKLDGTPSDTCAAAKTSCEAALRAKCDSECEDPVVTENICSKKGNKRQGFTCKAECEGTCGKKKSGTGNESSVDVLF